jgi:hypothetical protein
MSDSSPGQAAVKPDPRRDERTTIRWSDEELERIGLAAGRLSDETHTEVTVTGLIRGAVMRRCEEVLGPVVG